MRDRLCYLGPILAVMLRLIIDDSLQVHEHVGAWALPELSAGGEAIYLVLIPLAASARPAAGAPPI